MKKNDLSPEAFRFEGKMSLKQALPLGMQHVLAMFVGNLTPPPIEAVTELNTPMKPEEVPMMIGTLPPMGPMEYS